MLKNTMNTMEMEDMSWLYEDEDDYIEKVYADELEAPAGFEYIKLQHGLMAFSGCVTNDALISNFETVMNHHEYQLCTSTTRIGQIGVTLTGKVLVAANIDIASVIGENNRRYFYMDDRIKANIVKHIDDLELFGDQHNELIVVDHTVKAIWIKDYAENELKELADKLAKQYDLPLVVVK